MLKNKKYVTDQIFQIPLIGGGENLVGNFTRDGLFYQVMDILGGMNLIIQAFFKVKNIIL